MAEDPFEKARKEMERAQRDFHEQMARAQQELRGVLETGQRRIAEALSEFHERMALLRADRRPPGWAPRPGPKKPPRGRFGWDPRPREPGPGGPQPTPVRPPNPSFLSGGAEAPLDE